MCFLWAFYLYLRHVCDTSYLAIRYNLDWYKPFKTRRICPRGNYTIQRSCEECGKIFTPPTLVSKYCCPACSKRAYKKRQIAKEKEAIRQALIRRIPSCKGYLTVKEAMLIYGISKDVLYRMIRQGLIPSYNFGQRLIRLSRQYMDEHFKTKAGSRKEKKGSIVLWTQRLLYHRRDRKEVPYQWQQCI